MTERDAEPSADAVKLVDDFETAAIHRGCCPHAGGCSSDDCLPRLGRNRAALLDHIAGQAAEIERYRAAYEVEKKYSALRCDEVARLRTENETLNADKGRGHRYRDKMLAELAAKDAEIERLKRPPASADAVTWAGRTWREQAEKSQAEWQSHDREVNAYSLAQQRRARKAEAEIERLKAQFEAGYKEYEATLFRAEMAEAELAATPKELRTWWQAEEARHKAVETYNAKRQRHIDEGVFPPVVQEEFARVMECEKATSTALKALFAVRSLPASEPAPAQASPVDRDTLGRFVREAWIRWALTQQPRPKPSWLIPYDELSEAEKEADRQIGEAVTKWTLIHQDAARAFLVPAQASPGDALREVSARTTDELRHELARCEKLWEGGDFEGGGSPREFLDERMQEIEAELRKRHSAPLNPTGEA